MPKTKTLPTFYYVEHFNEFLRFFDGRNAALLSGKASEFIRYYRSAAKDVQALIVRIANRKHAVIATKSLDYDELHNVESLLKSLADEHWISALDQAEPEQICEALPKKDLVASIRLLGGNLTHGSHNKPSLQAHLLNLTNDSKPSQLKAMPYICRQFDFELRYLLFLYFGHLRGKLNQFSMRDLGLMRTRDDAVTGEARFDDATDAQNAFHFALLREKLRQKKLSIPPSLEHLPSVFSVEATNIKNRYLFELGKYFLPTQRSFALRALALSSCDEAREKWLRELYKDGEKARVEDELTDIMQTGSSENLLQFAEDFYARKYKQKRTSTLTDMLRSATQPLRVDSRYNQQVEHGVVAHYRRRGLIALKTENQLWRSLFGLVFWPILFEQHASNLANPFERAPQILKNNQLYEVHKLAIDQLVAKLNSADALLNHIAKQASLNFGKVNALFLWRTNILEHIRLLINYSPWPAIHSYLIAASKDFESLRDGYPDILVIEDSKIRFEEIKAPGDTLRRNQLISIQKLQKFGFDVRITQVEWFRDPEQVYAVVDIETTGGKAEHHRITEIGVVKMRGTEVIDQWQSLINPQRAIPKSITSLTGIDNAMVANAPIFSEISSDFEEFTKDAIFVAHNVNFDLSFIKHEFARLGETFRRPKLCTVQQCRRVFPGLSRYSLAALTDHFDIDMQRHHRALSDAMAAAELLKLVLENEKIAVHEQKPMQAIAPH